MMREWFRIVVAAGVVIITLGVIFYQLRTPAKFPSDFPYAWVAAGTRTTDAAAIIVVPGRAPEVIHHADGTPGTDIQVDGRHLFPAYTCTDPACPGRDAQGHALLFAYDPLGDLKTAFPACPACNPTPGKAKKTDSQIQAYVTPEGALIVRNFTRKP